MPINDCQLSRQKIRQKISVIKTNSFDWELLTFDDIKKIAHFGIFIIQKLKSKYSSLKKYKRKFSTTTINDRQLSSQKICQKISVIITNTNPPLQTFLFSRQNMN